MKLCLVGSLPGIGGSRLTGGAERQLMLLAESMVARGHRVACVLPAAGAAKEPSVGYSVLPGWLSASGVPGIRWFTHRLPHLFRNLVNLDADVYYCRGSSIFAATVVRAARKVRRPALAGLASDTDLVGGKAVGTLNENLLGRLSSGRLARWYFVTRGLHRATWVIAQNQWQYERCRTMGLSVAMVKSIVPEIADRGHVAPGAFSDAIWVGSLSKWKGIDRLCGLVTALPGVRFEIIGPKTCSVPPSLIDSLVSKKNVTWSDELEHSAVLQRIKGARLLVNTSPHEGMSNAMLEAWALQRPVISLTADPDGLLSSSEALGACAQGDLSKMKALVLHWLSEGSLRTETGERARAYIQKSHSPVSICEVYERLASA